MTWFSYKVQKLCFWAILGHFCTMGIFSKKSGSVTLNYIWIPNIMLSFRKKWWANPVKTYGQTEGWMDRPYFIGPFRPRSGVQQAVSSKWLVGIHQSCFKENAKMFSKNSTTQENITILRLKQDYKTYTKKKISNQKLNQWLKNYKMNLRTS